MDSASIISRALNLPIEQSHRMLRSKSVRRMNYKDIVYFVLKREFEGYPEGTSILYSEGSEPRVVPGYPPIKRILILETAVKKHFKDIFVVEEKMNGYNVRLVFYNGEVLALTRGGFICPYTTHRISESLSSTTKKEIASLENAVIYGEVVGIENPYTRYRYPEAPFFTYFVFDIMLNGVFIPIDDRRKLVDELALKNVREIARLHPENTGKLYEIIDNLEEEAREGVVLKDPLNRTLPLKYTTSATNIGDIREGMRFFFDEGRTYIFPRVLREIFVAFERGRRYWDKSRAEKLGESLVYPSLNCIEKVSRGKICSEEFVLRMSDKDVLEEFIEYMHKIGILVVLESLWKEGSFYVAKFLKPKKTFSIAKNILETGLSPLD